MDFCLRFEIPSGALPVGFEDFDFGLLAPDLAGPDFPFEPLPLVEGFEAAILEKENAKGGWVRLAKSCKGWCVASKVGSF